MNHSICDIIESGIIAEYVFGTLTKEEEAIVKDLIDKHPALQEHMACIKKMLQGMASEMDISPPPDHLPSDSSSMMASTSSEGSRRFSNLKKLATTVITFFIIIVITYLMLQVI